MNNRIYIAILLSCLLVLLTGARLEFVDSRMNAECGVGNAELMGHGEHGEGTGDTVNIVIGQESSPASRPQNKVRSQKPEAGRISPLGVRGNSYLKTM